MDTIKVLINEDAREYINEKSKDNSKDNSIIISTINSGSVWRPQIELSVKIGKPIEDNGFNLVDAEGINVYFKKDMEFKRKEIRIILVKILWKKYLKIEN